MITFNIIYNEEVKHIAIVVGYSYTLESNVVYIKDKEERTSAIFNNATVEQLDSKYYNIYV